MTGVLWTVGEGVRVGHGVTVGRVGVIAVTCSTVGGSIVGGYETMLLAAVAVGTSAACSCVPNRADSHRPKVTATMAPASVNMRRRRELDEDRGGVGGMSPASSSSGASDRLHSTWGDGIPSSPISTNSVRQNGVMAPGFAGAMTPFCRKVI